MVKLNRSLIYFIRSMDHTDVSMSILRHDDKKCHIEEGSGAKPVEQWSIYLFFKTYTEGRKEEAVKNFTNWYLQQYVKYSHIDKRYGGMFKGSLYNVIEKARGKNKPAPDNASAEIENSAVLEAITIFVRDRFKLLDSIRAIGYSTKDRVKIIGVRRKDHIIIRNGHHRVAALKALGFSQVPLIQVYPNTVSYFLAKNELLRKAWRKLRTF